MTKNRTTQAEIALASSPHNANLTCEVCGSEISFSEALQLINKEFAVCGSFDCRQILSQKAVTPPALFESRLRHQKKLILERRAVETEYKKRQEAEKANESKQNDAIFRDVLGRFKKLPKKNSHLVVIPSGLHKRSTLSTQRIDEYAEHLREKLRCLSGADDRFEYLEEQDHRVAQNIAVLEQWLNQNPSLKTISDSLCGICKGGCCVDGGNHAYIKNETIYRIKKQFPYLTDEQLLQTYLSYLSEETIADSCINNSTKGCVLPRELRSDICNAYYCRDIREFQRKVNHRNDTGVVVAIRRAGTNWNRDKSDVNNDIIDVALVEKPMGGPRIPVTPNYRRRLTKVLTHRVIDHSRRRRFKIEKNGKRDISDVRRLLNRLYR